MTEAYRAATLTLVPTRRPMTPADIRRQVVAEELDLAPDGRFAVVGRRAIRGNRYVTHLYRIALDRGRVAAPQRLTGGIVRDGCPRISPDGRWLAFVRSEPLAEDRPASAVLLDLRSGRERRLRHRGHGAVGEVAWSPDGRRLAFTAEVDPPRFVVGDAPPADAGRRSKRAGATSGNSPVARRIVRADWRWDDAGHLDRWSHLFVAETKAGAQPRQLTTGDWGVSAIAWSPDGRRIAFAADPMPGADLRHRTTIWDVAADGEGPPVTSPRRVMAGGSVGHPVFSPDGRWLAAIGVLDPEPLDDASPTILVGPADGSAPAWALAPDLDRPVGNWVDTDLNGWMVSNHPGPCWLDERTIVTTLTDRGRSLPVRFEIDPASGRPSAAPAAVPTAAPRSGHGPWSDATSHAIAVARGGTVAVLGTLGTRAMELMTLEADRRGRPRWATRSTFGSAWQRAFEQPEMRRLDAPGPGGPIEVWVASPPGAGGEVLPTVVDIHGGPLGAWAPAPHIEVTLLTGRGYRVILPNIRGSTGYGGAWIRPHLGDWGGPDAEDVHAVLDHVIGLGLADPERLGVLGLSYGGFLVHWLIGTSDRFRAAVSENGVTNQISAWANSDSGPEYDRASRLGDTLTPEGVERLWRQSPLRHVAAIRTPLLMLQAEADHRCPPSDNEQLFVALRHLGRTVEYVLYPDESHVFSSSGRPDRRIDRMTRMLDWFDRHLRPAG